LTLVWEIEPSSLHR